MFGRRSAVQPAKASVVPPGAEASPAPEDPNVTAIDALAGALRAMAEFPLEQEKTDLATFRQLAESWAQHVVIAAPAPGVPPEEAARAGARRDWEGVRSFVRDYCRSTARHAASVTTDLRDVIWVFIRTLSQSFAQDEEADERIGQQVARLEKLVEALTAADLKREVTETVAGLGLALQERRQRQRSRMAALGETVRALGDELVSARRDGETDPLTRVANRKAFDLHLQQTLEMHRAFGQDASLVLVDVDRFKEINDRCGHLAGDQVLREVADAIVKVFLRKSDFVARFGGDEFAVVLRETSARQLPALCERVLSRVRALRVASGGPPLAVSVSMGGAAAEAADDVKSWFERADRGLYAAKAGGRDRFALGEPGVPPGAGPGAPSAAEAPPTP